MQSLVDLPNTLVELQKILIGDIVEPLFLLWLIGPLVPRLLLLLLMLSLPSRVVLLLLLLLLLILLPSFFLFIRVRIEFLHDFSHLILGEDPVVPSLNLEGLRARQWHLTILHIIKITKLICSEPPVSSVNTEEATRSYISDIHKYGAISRLSNRNCNFKGLD